MQGVLDAAMDVGKCIVQCFVKDNGLQECFEGYKSVQSFHYQTNPVRAT